MRRTIPTHRLGFVALCLVLASSCGRGVYRGRTTPGVDVSAPRFVPRTIIPRGSPESSYELLVGLTEVTQRQWRDVMGTDPSDYSGCDDCPVELVTFYDAAAFANALSAREGRSECYRLESCTERPRPNRPFRVAQPRAAYEVGRACGSFESLGPTCDGYRLPTPDEWIAFAHITEVEDGDADPNEFGVVSVRGAEFGTRAVATRRPNRQGVYDTLGNVGEWLDRRDAVPDDAARYQRRSTDQTWITYASTNFRTRRGWLDCNHFHTQIGSLAMGHVGFRVVRTAFAPQSPTSP